MIFSICTIGIVPRISTHVETCNQYAYFANLIVSKILFTVCVYILVYREFHQQRLPSVVVIKQQQQQQQQQQ
jgi:hypothetical protein